MCGRVYNHSNALHSTGLPKFVCIFYAALSCHNLFTHGLRKIDTSLSICKISFLHFADTQRSVCSKFLYCKQTIATECCTPTRRLRLAFGDFRAQIWNGSRSFFRAILPKASKTTFCVRFKSCQLTLCYWVYSSGLLKITFYSDIETAWQFRQQCQNAFLQFLRRRHSWQHFTTPCCLLLRAYTVAMRVQFVSREAAHLTRSLLQIHETYALMALIHCWHLNPHLASAYLRTYWHQFFLTVISISRHES